MSNDKIATGPSLPAKSGFGLLVAKNAAENPCRQTDTISKVIQPVARRAGASSPQPTVNNFGAKMNLPPD
ncbi:MAG: hypothetical protein ABSF38_18640, partial [Verrucomicrobiota bacterium]